MKKIFLGIISMPLIVACEQQELENNEFLSEMLSVKAEITSASNPATRTTTSGTKVSFAEGDRIGFYMPDAGKSGLWTLSSSVWSSSVAYVWPDKVNSFTFCAYYPYTASENRTSISMPDLTTQTGDAAELGSYDFLVARSTCSYSTSKGAVSFTGKQAFKHVYSLLSITLKTSTDTKNAVLNELQLTAPGLVSSHTYHFGESNVDDGMTLQGRDENDFKRIGLNDSIHTDGYNSMYVVNPIAPEENVTISIKYTRGEEQFTASTQVSAATIQKGNLNKLTITIKKSGLLVSGNTVEDWNEESLGEIEIEESPETQSKE